MITLRNILGKPDVIFRDSPLAGLNMFEKTGNDSSDSHVLKVHMRVRMCTPTWCAGYDYTAQTPIRERKIVAINI